MSKVRSRLRVEALEGREVPAAVGFPWGNAGHLTLSFAPDGTDVGGQASSLSTTFAAAPDYQRDILRAFQTWAVQANVSVALTGDDGTAFGAAGPVQGDRRFGDIRIAAAPMSGESIAVSAPHDPFIAGTWAGDVVFNAGQAFGPGGADVFAVALHEAGHVLGLDHNRSPASVMFSHLGNQRTAPSPADVSSLRTLYGTRAADPYEKGPYGNNLLRTATRMDLLPDADFDGEVPLAVYGDLRGTADVDHFSVVIPTGYTRSVTFRLQTAGVSLLNPSLTILDGMGNRLKPTVSSTKLGGDVLEVKLDGVVPGRAYYARVDGATGDVFGIGTYALAVSLDNRLDPAVTPERIDAVLRGPYRSLGQEDLQYLFEDPAYLLNVDNGGNDTAAGATRLVLPRGYRSATHYEFLGSLGQNAGEGGPPGADVDTYAVRTPGWARPGALTATVWVQDPTAPPPELRVTDALGNPVAFDVLANGNGTYTVQAAGAAGRRDYLVAVSGPDGTNYNLAVDLTTRPASVESFTKGALTAAAPNDARALYVGQSQVFDFILTAAGPAGSAVRMSVLNALGQTVWTVTAPAGRTATDVELFLPGGAYALVFEGLSGATGYTLRGAGLTRPIGPIVHDPSGQPVFTAPGTEPGTYVYPGDLVGYDPYLADQLQTRYGIQTTPPGPTDPVAALDPFLIAPIFTIQ